MPHKKKSTDTPASDTALVEKVDAMMDIRYVAKQSVQPTPPQTTATQSADAIDIFKDLNKPAPIAIVEPKAAPASPKTVAEAPMPKSTVELEDTVLDTAVDEIVVAESDALLAAEDIVATVAPPAPAKKPGLSSKFKRFLR